MVLLRAGACVPASIFKLSLSCTCGSCKCGVTNARGPKEADEEQDSLIRPPKQLDMSDLMKPLTPSAVKARRLEPSGSCSADPFSMTCKAGAEELKPSTESGSAAETFPKDSRELIALKSRCDSMEERDSWYTPSQSPAECRSEVDHADVEAAVAAALAPASASTVRNRYSEDSSPLPCQEDWWDNAETRVVPGLETAPSLTRLLCVDIVNHPKQTMRRAPWLQGESHALYRRLGMRDASSSYVATWLNMGENSMLSVSETVDRSALERCLASDPLGKRLKLLIRTVKCRIPFPGKGPKEADTVGAFFGKGASLTRAKTSEGVDVVVVQIDLYYLTLLRFALSNVGFRHGNVVEIILVDWPGQAVLSSNRLEVTDEFLKRTKG